MSKVHLQNLNKIKQKRKDTVIGYIRSDQSLQDMQIPDGIILICILFYGSNCDKFDPKWKGKGMILSKDDKCVHNRNELANIYCKKIIDSGYHEWKFKIVKVGSDEDCLMIGLWRCSKDCTPPLNKFFTSGKDQGYGWRSMTKKGRKSRSRDGCYSEQFMKIAN